MKRSLVGFLVAIVLAATLLAAVWALFPSAASPASILTGDFDALRRATDALEAYPFVTILDESVQATSWRRWINDGSADTRTFLIGAARMQGKLFQLTGAVFAGILVAFAARGTAKFTIRKMIGYNRINRVLGRWVLLLGAAIIASFLAPVAICNDPGALLFSLPLAIGLGIAMTGKDPEKAQ